MKIDAKQQVDEKLQKVLASAGYGSRRAMEVAIVRGRVSINGRVATLGDRVMPTDKIVFDGKPIRTTKNRRVRLLMYNKPEGEICTRSDPEGRSFSPSLAA